MQVGSLSQRVAELEGLMERADREKTSLTGQLEEVYRKLTEQEADNSKAWLVLVTCSSDPLF